MRKVKKALCTALIAGFVLTQATGAAFAANGTWKHNSKGWWYAYSDGTYEKSGWAKINGKWYYFDASGYMATGWIKDGGKWYYLKKSGEMATGWIKDGGKWYFLSPSGAMVTGWRKINDVWYYFSGSGAMVTGWRKLGGNWYYFEGSGAMVTGWQYIGDFQYYFFEDGVMATGTVNIDGGDYIFDENGALIIMSFEDDYPMVGGWSFAPRPLNDEEKIIFEKSKPELVGVDYEAVQVLATQIVSGTNYLFLCHATNVYTGSKPTYALIQVYNDLEGNSQMTGITFSDVEVPNEELDGGYFEREDMAPTEEDLADFSNAAQLLTGVEYVPIAVVDFQVVMGLNFRVLCLATPVVPNSDSYFTFVNFYEYDGTYSIISIEPMG